MRMQMIQTLRLECDVCKQVIDSNQRQDAKVGNQLFGAIPFAICPCCEQEVKQYHHKPYRKRAIKWQREHHASRYYLLQWVTVTPVNCNPCVGIITSIRLTKDGIIYGVKNVSNISTGTEIEVSEDQLKELT